MMRNYDESVEISWSPKSTYIPDHSYRILIIGGSASDKTNALLLTNYRRTDIDRNYLQVKDPFESNYQLLINRREKVGMKQKKFKSINWLFKNLWWCLWELRGLESYKGKKKFIVFGDVIADMKANKKLSSIVTELFLNGRKLNISLVFISQPHFKVPKTVRLNATQYFIMKIPNKRELHQIALNYCLILSIKILWSLTIKDYTKETVSVLVNRTTLPSEISFIIRNYE